MTEIKTTTVLDCVCLRKQVFESCVEWMSCVPQLSTSCNRYNDVITTTTTTTIIIIIIVRDLGIPRHYVLTINKTRIWHVPAKHANRMDARAHTSTLAECAPRFMTPRSQGFVGQNSPNLAHV